MHIITLGRTRKCSCCFDCSTASAAARVSRKSFKQTCGYSLLVPPQVRARVGSSTQSRARRLPASRPGMTLVSDQNEVSLSLFESPIDPSSIKPQCFCCFEFRIYCFVTYEVRGRGILPKRARKGCGPCKAWKETTRFG